VKIERKWLYSLGDQQGGYPQKTNTKKKVGRLRSGFEQKSRIPNSGGLGPVFGWHKKGNPRGQTWKEGGLYIRPS